MLDQMESRLRQVVFGESAYLWKWVHSKRLDELYSNMSMVWGFDRDFWPANLFFELNALYGLIMTDLRHHTELYRFLSVLYWFEVYNHCLVRQPAKHIEVKGTSQRLSFYETVWLWPHLTRISWPEPNVKNEP